MAKGKRSNSPKRSRRGGRRSPKKSNKGVHKMINKDVSECPLRHPPPQSCPGARLKSRRLALFALFLRSVLLYRVVSVIVEWNF